MYFTATAYSLKGEAGADGAVRGHNLYEEAWGWGRIKMVRLVFENGAEEVLAKRAMALVMLAVSLW